MTAMRTILILSLLFATGSLLVILACALHSNWLPLLAALLFLFAPIPNALANRISKLYNESSSTYFSSDDDESNSVLETGYFITSVFLVSAIALPTVLAHIGVISFNALILSVSGGSLLYSTIVGYSNCFSAEEDAF